MRADAPLSRKRMDRIQVFAAQFGKAAAIFASTHADDRKPLDQRNVGPDRGDAPAGKAHHQQPAAKRGIAAGFVEHIAAHRIIDQIGPAPPGQVQNLRADGSRPDHHCLRMTERLHRIAFGIARNHGNRTQAQFARQIDGCQPHTARRAVHHQRFARLRPAQPVQRHPGGKIGHAQRSAFGKRKAIGQRLHGIAGKGAILGNAAEPAADHPVAHVPRGHIRAAIDHHPGAFHAGHERQRRFGLIETLRHQQVGKAERDRLDPHQHLARARLRDRPIRQRQPRQIIGQRPHFQNAHGHQWPLPPGRLHMRRL